VSLRRSHTAVVERNIIWSGRFETEPYEAAWATEAIFFVRILEGSGPVAIARVQISPDGMHWCDEGTTIELPAEGEVTFGRVSRFGTYLRICGRLEEGDERKVIVYVMLKE